jgi:hypothetical protein
LEFRHILFQSAFLEVQMLEIDMLPLGFLKCATTCLYMVCCVF